MKNFFVIITLIIGFNAYAQFDVTIKFKDGAVIKDKVKYLHNGKSFKSKTSKNKYRYRDISEMLVNNDNKPRHLFFLDVKKSIRYSTTHNTGIGILTYQNKRIELFQMAFGIRAFHFITNWSPVFKPNQSVFVRKKGEEFVYNIGRIDGHGDYKIIERLNNFFSDCPKLIKMIEDGKIDALDTIKICDYYNELCGKN